MTVRMVFYLFVISIAYGQHDSNPFTNAKCAFTFLIESAICSGANAIQEISWEFRPSWKHIRVVSTTGIFTLAG